MGFWDLSISIVLAVIPLLLIGAAIVDWRRSKRNRYFVLAGAYLLFGFGALMSFVSPNSSLTTCFSGVVVLIILGLVHNSFRRSDFSKSTRFPKGETKV